MYRMVIADDEEIVRNGIRETIDWQSLGIEVTACVGDGEALCREAIASKADIALVDIRMPILDGLSAIERIRKELPGCECIIFTAYEDFSYAFPFPALLFFAVVELDLLHARDHLDQVALVGRRGLETHVIQLSATFEEEQHPGNVQGASQQEYQQDSPIVTGHDAAVNDEGNDGHDCAKQRFGQE